MTEKSADDDDFDEFMEGILPAGPSDETGEGHLDFDEEDEPEVGDEGIVVEELITDNEEDGSGDSGRKRGGTGKRLGIGVAVLAVVGAAAGGGYWWMNRDTDTPVTRQEPVTPPVGGTDPGSKPAITISTIEILQKDFDQLTPDELDTLFDKILSGVADEGTQKQFPGWVEKNRDKIAGDEALRRKVIYGLLAVKPDGEVLYVPEISEDANNLLVVGQLYSAGATLLFGQHWLVPIAVRKSIVVVLTIDEDEFSRDDENTDQLLEGLRDATLPPFTRGKCALELARRYERKSQTNEGISVCSYGLRIVGNELQKLSADDGGGQGTMSPKEQQRLLQVLKGRERDLLLTRDKLLRPEPPRPTIAALKAQWTSLGVTDEQLDASVLPTTMSDEHRRQFEAVKANIKAAVAQFDTATANRPDTETLSTEELEAVNHQLETVRQGWLELRLRMQVASSAYSADQIQLLIDDINLDENLGGLNTADDVDNLQQPQLSEHATALEVTEFNAVRKAVGLAVVKLKSIIADTPDGQNLSTDSAAEAMIQLQILRTGWREMTVMRFMTANRTDGGTTDNGLTPQQVKATLSSLQNPDALPDSASPVQRAEFQQLENQVATIKTEIEASIAGKADREALDPTTAQTITTNLEKLRTGYMELQMRRLLPSGVGGDVTTYVSAQGNTVAVFKAALSGLRLPSDLSTLQLENAPPGGSAAFQQAILAMTQKRTAILAALEGKSDDEVLDAGIVATLAQAKEARLNILRSMLGTLSQPRAEISEHAPRLERTQIDPEKIGLLIGPGGKTIRA
ncbi:MAG: hypothetical protein ABGZ35_00955, partial [Planctomycetaceae bacterium]